jgi:hypothetical protein
LRGLPIFCPEVTLRFKAAVQSRGVVLSGSRRGWHLEMLVAAGLGLIGRIRITAGRPG